MKKLISALLVSTILLCTGCGSTDQVHTSGGSNTFIVVENSYSTTWKIVYHKDTKVMYAVSDGAYSHGIFTLLVNPDGTPMIYGEN